MFATSIQTISWRPTVWTVERWTTALSDYWATTTNDWVLATTTGRNEFHSSSTPIWNASWRRRIVIRGHLSIIGYFA